MQAGRKPVENALPEAVRKVAFFLGCFTLSLSNFYQNGQSKGQTANPFSFFLFSSGRETESEHIGNHLIQWED